jgi:hypothetical protein
VTPERLFHGSSVYGNYYAVVLDGRTAQAKTKEVRGSETLQAGACSVYRWIPSLAGIVYVVRVITCVSSMLLAYRETCESVDTVAGPKIVSPQPVRVAESSSGVGPGAMSMRVTCLVYVTVH